MGKGKASKGRGSAGEKGAEAFDAYYGERFGERWPSLKAALQGPSRSLPYQIGLLQPYYLDAASVIAARCLPVSGAERLLDLCAAPGGKTLVLASRMDGDASLISNERSQDRRERLRRVLDEHLPPQTRDRVSVAGKDGAIWSRMERNAFDSILLDAPCSSERHVLTSPSHLDRWSPARVRHLAQGEWALLSGAFLVLKEGGSLLYATCALSDEENDGVVARLFSKYRETASSLEIRFVPEAAQGLSSLEDELSSTAAAAERTRYGYRVLPDAASGAGPLYFALIGKNRLT